jgi:hypothetical protein
MSQDNSPPPGGQEHDNAPMIKGRGMKVSVSARRAYKARSLRQLESAMSPDLYLTYIRAMISHVLAAVRDRIEPLSEVAECLSTLDRWLAEPTAEHLERLREASHHSRLAQPASSEARSFRYLCEITADVTASAWAHVSAGFELVLRNYVPRTYPYDTEMATYLNDWCIEAAWAVINSKPLPPLAADQQGLDRLFADAPLWYRKKNLQMLLRLLSDSQHRRFRQAILEQAFWYIDHLPAAYWPDSVRSRIALARDWLVDPDRLDQDALDALLGRRNEVADVELPFQLTAKIFTDLVKVVGDIYHAIRPDSAPDDLAVRSIQGATAMRTASHAAAYHIWRRANPAVPDNAWSPLSKSTDRQVKFWQLEAVWAILHDQPIPPHSHSLETDERPD